MLSVRFRKVYQLSEQRGGAADLSIGAGYPDHLGAAAKLALILSFCLDSCRGNRHLWRSVLRSAGILLLCSVRYPKNFNFKR